MEPSILFFGKENDFFCSQAVQFIQTQVQDATVFCGSRGQSFPKEAYDWEGDYVISYLSQWIIPERVLKKARKASVNFHPGPSEYPGIGCTNFAIYHQESSFGVTCHHMLPRVDTGEIIVEKRFPLFETDSVFSLTQRCYGYIIELFYEMLTLIIQEKPLPKAKINWKRKAFTRKELNALCRLDLDMDEKEINRRIKAVTFPNAPGAYLKVGSKTHKIGWI